MKLTYVVICYEDNDDDSMNILHLCGYEEMPSTDSLKDLKRELAEDPEFDLIGNDSYKMKVLDRNIPAEADLLTYLEVPEEINEEDVS